MGVENQKYGEDLYMNKESKILKNLDSQKDKNELFEKIKNNLDKPNKVSRLLGLVENEVDKITTKEDIQAYKDFLITVQNNIKDKVAPETITPEDISKDTYKVQLEYTDINTAIQTMLGSLSQKEQEFLAKETITANKDNNVKDEVHQELPTGNVDGLKNSLSALESNEIIEFEGVIDNLKNGLLTPEKIPQFAYMMNILRSMNGLKKDQIMSVVNTTIDTKFADKKDSDEIRLFKDTLSAVLDKGLVGKFVNQVDEDLNKNEKLKGWSYDVLLKPDTNFTSPEARAGILNIFNNDEVGFNKLVMDFADQTKKAQVEKIIKAYILASIPGGDNPSEADINSATISIDNNFIVDGGKKPAFIMTKLDGSPLGIAQKDANGDIVKDKEGKDVLSQRFTPFFGDAIHGKKLSPDQYMKPELMQQLLGKDSLKMEGVASVMKELVSINGTPRTFAEAITSLFNSPFFDQIKQAIYTLMAMFGKEDSQEKAMIEANYLTLKGDIRKRGSLSYKDKDGKDQTISYIDALNKFEPGVIKDGENYKAIFLGLSTDDQKKYIETAVTSGKDTAYAFLESIKGKKKVETKPTDEKKENEKSQEQSQPIEFVNNKATVPQLKINEQSQGLVERKGEGDNQYLTVDGQVIPLINGKGSIFVKADGQIIEKVISFDKKDNKENIIITDGDNLDMGLLETIKKTGNLSVLGNGKLDDNKLKLAKYYMFGKSIDGINNPIDGLLAGINKLGPDQKKISELSLVKFQKEMLVLMSGNISNTSEIVNPFTNITKEFQSIKIGDNIQQKERNIIVENRENNYHS